jgi:hypothetical protein
MHNRKPEQGERQRLVGQRKLDRNKREQRRDPEPDLDEGDAGEDNSAACERRPRRGPQMAVDKAKFLLLGIILTKSEMCISMSPLAEPIRASPAGGPARRLRLFEFRAEAIPADLAAFRHCNLAVASTFR